MAHNLLYMKFLSAFFFLNEKKFRIQFRNYELIEQNVTIILKIRVVYETVPLIIDIVKG